MSATAGKVALVNNTTALSGGCPSSGIIDFVGYGSTADCSEGDADAPAPSATNAIFRKNNGCIDTNNNTNDFAAAGASPRNSLSSSNICPSISINDVSKIEGNSGMTDYTFTISLSLPAPTGGITFNVATADNTATTADNDYVANSQTGLSIVAGSSMTTFTVKVNGDLVVESDETFFVNITNVSGASITDGQGQGTIQNDDCTAPVFTITPTNGACPTTEPSISLDAPDDSGYKYDITTGNTYTGTMTVASGGTLIESDPETIDLFPVAPTIAGTTYTIRLIDQNTGCYSDQTFTLSSSPPCPCANPPQVTINDLSLNTCTTSPVTINYTVANGPASLITDGAGTLSTNSLSNGTSSFMYTPASGDIGKTIKITATIADPDAGDPCEAATDEINIVVKAAVTVEAGTSGPICVNETLDLQDVGASVSNGTGTWSSSGSGSFTGGTTFGTATAYVPSTADKLAGTVTLTLTGTDPSGTCPMVTDTIVITIRNLNCATFPWNGGK